MWNRLVAWLRCPRCGAALHAAASGATERPLSSATPAGDGWVDSGLLLCQSCRTWYPIVHGVPVLLPYATPVHEDFTRSHRPLLDALPRGYSPPAGTPMPGERLVMQSFSTEWLQYDYDGVIWEMDYADHEQRFIAELGPYAPPHGSDGTRFLEIGCGLGLTTAMAQKNFGGDAVGVDLSLAAWRAAARHRANPFLHFVQASVFALPFAPETFDTIYTRGVLHHTFSTERAFQALAPVCRRGGSFYVWVYGPRSVNDNLFRRVIYALELVMRFVLNRGPSWLASIALAPIAVGYMLFNRVRRLRNPRIQPYDYRRALHAARDRFTPEFAHRQDAETVSQWFRDAEYVDLEVVDWRTMPDADHDDYRRNVGVRARRALSHTPADERARLTVGQ